MKKLQRAALIVSLVENLKANGSWCGETHVQKASYFLQELTNVPLGYEFVLYKHGPYSFDLNDELTSMRADTLLRLVPQPYPYGPSLLPGLGNEQLKQRFVKTITRYTRNIEFVASKLGSMKVVELERIATALYVIKEESSSKVESRAQRIHELKPHVSLEDAVKAVRMVDLIKKELLEIAS